MACFGVPFFERAVAQTFSVLHDFTTPGVNRSNSDGADPFAGLVLYNNLLYGITEYGGANGNGTIYKTDLSGTHFVVLASIVGNSTLNAQGGLIVLSNTLYGTTSGGGTNGEGTVFAVNTDGTSFRILHGFTGEGDGANPTAMLTMFGNTLYGTAQAGGTNGKGTVFKLNIDGSGFTNLHNFSGGGDGASPIAGLILSGQSLYGTAFGGGTNGNGTIFSLMTNGTFFTVLHTFAAGSGYDFTNIDGANPVGELMLSGNTLYGTTDVGGLNGDGTIYGLCTNGMRFATVHSFTSLISNSNNDGAYPTGGLILSGNILYGTAHGGGVNGSGTVFACNTNGIDFVTLYTFTAALYPPGTNLDGFGPQAGLILSNNVLYGTTYGGGINGYGTIFNLSIPSPASLVFSGPRINQGKTNFIFQLSGPSGTNYVLQVSTNLVNWNHCHPIGI